MPQRFLRPGITNSENWNAVSFAAQSFFVRILTLVDDFGRYDARPVLLRSHAFPVSPNISVSDVELLLDELSEAKLIQIYSVGGKDFLQVTRWQERARTASKYPDPPGFTERSQRQGIIYFIQGSQSKKIKIGFTDWKPENRLARLQTGSPEKLDLVGFKPGTPQEERLLHAKYSTHRVEGEWFLNCEELLREANACKQLLQVDNICCPPSPSPSPSPSPASPPTPPPSLSQGVESDPNLWPLKTPPAEPIQAGRERSEPIHQWFCKETGTEIRLDMTLERKWFDFFRAGFNEDQFKQVVAYLRKKVRTKERNEGALKLSNILDTERFNEDLALAQIAKLVAKPKQPTPTPLPPAPTKTAQDWEKGAQMARELREKLERGELV